MLLSGLEVPLSGSDVLSEVVKISLSGLEEPWGGKIVP